MKKILFTATTIAALGLTGCATQSINTFQPFQAEDLNSQVSSGELQQKKNSFFVINDSSSSMSNPYTGSGFSGQSAPTKLAVEKEILNRMNSTIPNVSLSSGLRSFGYGPCLDWGYTKLNQPVQNYSSASFQSAINSLECSSGGTPIGAAFDAATTDLTGAKGNIAVILLSDGNKYDTSPVAAIKSLQEQYGDKFCLYTIWVGNESEEAGQANLQQLSNISGCGFSTTASAVASSTGMANFVSSAFFNKVTLAPVDGDDDGDGVPNSIDKCPQTAKGAIVDRDGCWAFHGVLFDFDKTTINPGFEAQFDNAVKVLTLNPEITVEVQGHTDNTGPAEYNQLLSEKRAQAVRQHLITKGIDGARLTVKGFGESNPMTTNDTEEGRSHNRRVFYKRTDI